MLLLSIYKHVQSCERKFSHVTISNRKIKADSSSTTEEKPLEEKHHIDSEYESTDEDETPISQLPLFPLSMVSEN